MSNLIIHSNKNSNLLQGAGRDRFLAESYELFGWFHSVFNAEVEYEVDLNY